jgi:Protein of unknown function (DUF2946)
MDDIVKAALAKWPHVPACYGWLGLDARGRWFMRDDRTQAAGPFAGAGSTMASRGSHLRHEKLIEFMARNYEADERGCWFFQNGPQRVYVELEATPLIWRIQADFSVVAHTALCAHVKSVWMDERGRLYLHTEVGFGLVHTQDMVLAAEAVEQGQWVPREVPSCELPDRFGFEPSPASRRPEPARP